MPTYRVMVQGRNFLIKGVTGIEKHGFYTPRFIEAPDPGSAENTAVEQLRQRQSLRDLVMNDAHDPPMMYVIEIEDIEPFIVGEVPDPGLIWYSEAEDDETDQTEYYTLDPLPNPPPPD